MSKNVFEIYDGVLVKYNGNDPDVEVPDGVKEIKSVFLGNTNLKTVKIPPSVTEIWPNAFKSCSKLTDITISSDLTVLGDSVFKGCNSLADKDGFVIVNDVLFDYYGPGGDIIIPGNIKTISGSAFLYNSKVTKVKIPSGVDDIRMFAFSNCTNLKSIELPEGLRRIGMSTFYDCGNLEKIDLPDGLEKIDFGGFENCCSLKKIEMPENCTVGGDAFSGCGLETFTLNGFSEVGRNAFKGCPIDVNKLDKDTILYYFFKSDKTYKVLMNACEEMIDKDLTGNMERMLVLLEDCDDQKVYDRFVKHIISRSGSLSADFLKKANQLFVEKGMKSASNQLVKANLIKGDEEQEARKIKKLEKERQELEAQKQKEEKQRAIDAEKLARGERPDEKEIEEFVERYRAEKGLELRAGITADNGVYYRNSGIHVRPDVLDTLLSIYLDIWDDNKTTVYGAYGQHNELSAGWQISPSPEADHIYSYLDPVSMDKFLSDRIWSNDYRPYLLSLGRFASGSLVSSLVNGIRNFKKGTAKQRYWSENLEQALFLNESAEAMQYLDERKLLDYYAGMRGTTAQMIRDIKLIPDLGFDDSGVRRFIAADIAVTARVLPDLTVELRDENTGNVLKSFPKKGADSDLLSERKEEYDKFKKDVAGFGKQMLSGIKRLHVSQESINKDIWEAVYLNNPVVRVLSGSTIWSDGEETFIPSGEGTITVNGNVYEPKEGIRVANVISMDEKTVMDWRQYLIGNKIRQPFEQIWEPVLHIELNDLTERYKGLELSQKDRNALRKVMKEKGIDLYADAMESEYDHRNMTYVFGDRNTMHFGRYVDVEYLIKENRSIVFDKVTVKDKATKEAVNTIAFELEKAMMRHHIINDRADLITEEVLDLFALPQVVSFIGLAGDRGSRECSAILLDYRDRKYGTYDYTDELILDL